MSDPRDARLRIGIDVGGTNTDAVVLNTDDDVIAKIKVPTTPDTTTGITNAVGELCSGNAIDPAAITHVMIGTTHATNAILERNDLGRVAVVRVGGPATHMLPPMAQWPEDLREVVSAGEIIIPGGTEMDGTDLYPLDVSPLEGFFGSLGPFDSVAVIGVFSPVSNAHELETRKAVTALIGEAVPVVTSHSVGSIGLVERENATILNAALSKVAAQVTDGVRKALMSHGIRAVTYFAQNDGTLMSLDYVHRLPVLTIGSGPANSMRGAAYLSGLKDAIIVDVGGTSTDVGVLVNGFPRTSAIPVEIGGVKTNFRMPDLVAIALGGGTILSGTAADLRVGPQSVGYRITEEALTFGGSTPTVTDAATREGRADFGPVEPEGDPALFTAAISAVDAMIADAVDRVKTTRADQPLVAVGGGSFLVPNDMEGISAIHRPDHHDVANAIGAAIASVSGHVDRLYDIAIGGRDKALEQAREDAISEAVRLGADPDGTEIVDIEQFNVLYLASTRLRIRAKAAGPLAAL